MSNIFEEKAKEIGYELDKSYITFPNTSFEDIKIFQTALAPEEDVYIHPLILGKILNSTAANQITDIIQHKG